MGETTVKMTARTAKGWFIVFIEHPTGRWVLQLKVCIHRDCEKSKEEDESGVHITSSQVLEIVPPQF